MKSSNDFAHDLVAVAERDIVVLRTLLNNRQIDDAIWGFHAQQATEKLLKGIIASLSLKPPFTHQLMQLADVLEDKGIDLPLEFDVLMALTSYAGELRYSPTLLHTSDPLDRVLIMTRIDELREFTRKQTGF